MSPFNDRISLAQQLTRAGFLRAAGAGAAAALLAGCGGGGSGSSARTASSAGMALADLGEVGGALRVMTYAGYEGGKAIQPWLASTGVDLKATVINNQDDVTTRLRTPAGRRTDAAQLGLAQLEQYRELGIAYPMQPDWFENFGSLIPYFRELVTDRDGALTTMPFVWGSLGCSYLPGKMDPIASWQELTKPRFKNRIAMIDDPVSTVQTGALAVGIRDPSRMTVDQLGEVKEFLLRVKANSRTLAAGYGDIADLLAAGDVWTSFQGWNAVEAFAAAKGAVVRTAYPDEGVVGFIDSFFIPATAENKATAVAFVDHMISPTMQAYVGNDLSSGIVNLAAASRVRGAGARSFDYDDLDELFRTKLVFALDAPLRASDDIATHDDWVATWEDVKAA